MNIERIVAGTERGFAEKSCDYIEGCIRAFQKMSSAGSFVMGLSGPNGRVRRARALDTFTELAKREHQAFFRRVTPTLGAPDRVPDQLRRGF